MPDLREKLIEMLTDDYCPLLWMQGEVTNLADYLIAHGVTVQGEPLTNCQQWIPVAERLPDLIPCIAGTGYSEAVIMWTTGRKAMIAVWDGTDFLCAADYWDAMGEEITHWMPLPQPPKGG